LINKEGALSMGELKYSKKFNVENKVFREEDIKCIAKIFKGLFMEGDYQRRIVLEFDDESRLQGDDIDIFSTDEFSRRRCVSVSFDYESENYNKGITICLFNAALSSMKSYVSLYSVDKEWYESILNRVGTTLREVPCQKKFMQNPLLHEGWISFVELLFLCFMALRVPSINAFLFSIPWIAPVLIFFLVYLVILRWNYNLVQKVRIAYPNIEFAFGADHKNESLRAKHIIAIVLPFVFEIIALLLGWCF
jgi:hypothetical protein